LRARDGCTLFCRSDFPRSPTRSVLAARPLRRRASYSRPSGLGCSPHRGDFHPYATLTLGLGRSILFNHHLYRAMAKCSRPTVFRVPPLLTGLSESITFPLRFHTAGGSASGLVRGRFPSTQGFPLRHSGWRYLRPWSHRPACAHLSERCLAHADYSCRDGSPVDSEARGVTPDFVHPPFSLTRLPPGEFVPPFGSIRIEWTTSSTSSGLPASTVAHLALRASV